MKYKLLFETKNVPTFEDFEKSIHQYEGCSIRMIIERACQTISYSFIKGYLLTPVNQCYRFEYCKETSRILTETIGELKPKVPLTFDTLRKANVRRLPEFKNSKGLPAHSKSDGSDWSPAQWLQAVIGELGEYANVMKKVERGDLTFEEAKPLIKKELADVMTYLDILAFRVGVDLAKATEDKFNEVSERVGCGLRIENNEVVRKPDINKTYGFVLPTYPQAVDFVKLGSEESTKFSINNRKSYVSPTKEELQEELAKIKENVRARNESMREKCGTSILENYDYNPKNGEFTPKKTPLTKSRELIKEMCRQQCGTITNIKVQTTNLILNENVTLSVNVDDEIKVSVKPKLSDKEFKTVKEACKIPREQIKGLSTTNAFDLFRQMYHQEWVEKYKQYAYPLEISRDQITDIFGFDFLGIDDGKQYLFYSVKNGFLFYRETIAQNWLLDYFSKQLGTKIVGMLINGHKKNKILNPNDTVQFYDDRNVLYNFRLVKSSDKNVGVSLT